MNRVASLGLIAALAAGCAGASATPSPTPSPAPVPTATPAPTPSPTPVPTAPPSATPQAHDITIHVVVHGHALGSDQTLLGLGATSCETRDGYSDIGPGMQATIHDPAGTVVGVATFTTVGESTATEQGPIGPIPTECTFATVAKNVPDVLFYGIEVGTRGTVQFSRDELAASDWLAQLSLGN